MSFLERAKAAATDLAAKADVAMNNAGIQTPTGGGGGERALRDLGVIAWLDATGRPVPDADRERVMGSLRQLETAGQLGRLTVSPPPPAAAGPPPPPGAAAAPPPPPPPSSGPAGPVSPSGEPLLRPPAPRQEPQTAPPGSTPPPPPPSWASPPPSSD